MAKPNKDQQPIFRRFDNRGSYMVSVYDLDEAAIARLTPKEQAIMELQTHRHPVRDISIGSGSALANIGIATTAYTVGMPLWAFIAGEATTMGASAYTTVGSILGDKRIEKRQRAIAAALSKDEQRTMRFARNFIPFSLPQSVLEQSVAFQSEVGPVTRTVGELAQSAGNDYFGIRCEISDDAHAPVDGAISPGDLVARALTDVPRKQIGDFLDDASQSIAQLHSSVASLPRYELRTAGLPEGIKRLNERHKTNMLIGALGIYGAVRARVGVVVSEGINNLYAMHGDSTIKQDPLLEDSLLFAAPTENNLPWQQIDRTRSYIRATMPLDENIF